MQKLVNGIHVFQENVHRPMHEFFEKLSYGQQPRALFVTCCDSRVNPDLMTQAEPGDLFMIRNAGNLVPSYGASGGGEAATIEYAIAKLGVSNVIVCGHSCCGAMKALMDSEALRDLPALNEWLHHASASRRIALKATVGMTPEAAWEEVAKINVLIQIENLRTHPVVAEGLIRGDLFLHAWYYCFASGDVQVYHPDTRKYISVGVQSPVSTVPPLVAVEQIASRAGTSYGAWIAEGSQPSFNGQPKSEPRKRRHNGHSNPNRAHADKAAKT